MTPKVTFLALTLGLALPVAAATTATITPSTPLPPCGTSPQDATKTVDAAPANADVTCAPARLGTNIRPLAGGGDDESDAQEEDGDND